jgi:hypothetical protein
MINRYRSLHRNHVHQLIVSVSKHYFLTKDGCLKYQQKPFEISLSKLSESKKTNIVIASIRDHTTGLFYAEIFNGPSIPNIYNFLKEAWLPKDNYPFCGLPELITLPKVVEAQYPFLSSALKELGVNTIPVTSGFQGGVRDIKTIESSLAVCYGKEFNDSKEWVRRICAIHAHEKGRTEIETKAEMWNKSDFEIRFPPKDWWEKYAQQASQRDALPVGSFEV